VTAASPGATHRVRMPAMRNRLLHPPVAAVARAVDSRRTDGAFHDDRLCERSRAPRAVPAEDRSRGLHARALVPPLGERLCLRPAGDRPDPALARGLRARGARHPRQRGRGEALGLEAGVRAPGGGGSGRQPPRDGGRARSRLDRAPRPRPRAVGEPAAVARVARSGGAPARRPDRAGKPPGRGLRPHRRAAGRRGCRRAGPLLRQRPRQHRLRFDPRSRAAAPATSTASRSREQWTGAE
jgi:hypothetical protein